MTAIEHLELHGSYEIIRLFAVSGPSFETETGGEQWRSYHFERIVFFILASPTL